MTAEPTEAPLTSRVLDLLSICWTGAAVEATKLELMTSQSAATCPLLLRLQKLKTSNFKPLNPKPL